MTLPMWINIIWGLILLSASMFLGRMLEKSLRTLKTSTAHNTLFLSLAGTVIKTICNCIGILFFLGVIGVNVAFIIKTVAVFGVGLGYIFKDPVGDVAAGFFIATYKPLGVGMELTVTGDKTVYTGNIKSIDLRYITLENSSQTVLIPNSFLFKQPICITKK